MNLYARHPETNELTLIADGQFTARGAYEQMDLMDAEGDWPIAHVPVIECRTGWHWLCSANFSDRWLPGEGTLEERLVYGGYRAGNPLPVTPVRGRSRIFAAAASRGKGLRQTSRGPGKAPSASPKSKPGAIAVKRARSSGPRRAKEAKAPVAKSPKNKPSRRR